MPWIIKHDGDVYEAAEVYTEERIIDLTTYADPEPVLSRSSELHMRAVILHAPDGDTKTMQNVRLHSTGPFEVTWQEESWTP